MGWTLRPVDKRADSGDGVLGRRQRAPPRQIGSLGESCKLPRQGLGHSPGKFVFWSILGP